MWYRLELRFIGRHGGRRESDARSGSDLCLNI
jgi:hypothetical protein